MNSPFKLRFPVNCSFYWIFLPFLQLCLANGLCRGPCSASSSTSHHHFGALFDRIPRTALGRMTGKQTGGVKKKDKQLTDRENLVMKSSFMVIFSHYFLFHNKISLLVDLYN